jgi:hypothetical protein
MTETKTREIILGLSDRKGILVLAYIHPDVIDLLAQKGLIHAARKYGKDCKHIGISSVINRALISYLFSKHF